MKMVVLPRMPTCVSKTVRTLFTAAASTATTTPCSLSTSSPDHVTWAPRPHLSQSPRKPPALERIAASGNTPGGPAGVHPPHCRPRTDRQAKCLGGSWRGALRGACGASKAEARNGHGRLYVAGKFVTKPMSYVAALHLVSNQIW